MKINLDSIEQASSPIELFYQGCKSIATRRNYTASLKKIVNEFFEDVLESEGFENRVSELVTKGRTNPEWLMGLMVALMKALRERSELDKQNDDFLSTRAIDNYLNALKKLLDMNEIPLVWRKIYSMKPEQVTDDTTRGYTREEIQTMLKYAEIYDRVVVLIASSSGIRIGAFDFTWKDIRPVYHYKGKLLWQDEEITESVTKEGKLVCGLILIYKNSTSSQFAFITPEAYQSVLDYRGYWIRKIGHEPRESEPFLIHVGAIVKPVSEESVSHRISRLLKEAGLRKPLVKGQRRHEVPIMNGFRRYFNKTNKESISNDSTLAQLIKKERMMGHKVGLITLDRNYFKTHVNELIDEYLNAIPNLTISDELRYELKIQEQTKELSKYKNDQSREIQELREERIKDKREMLQLLSDIASNPEKLKGLKNQFLSDK